jgi:hypothetical protein
MTVLETGDVRGFYEALGVDLPGWAHREAPVCCFASPDSHNHGDRTPSTSVNLESGAWCCHGCGAHGGAYDAALAVGHTPRSAIELMIAHGLIDSRHQETLRVTTAPPTSRAAASRTQPRLTVADGDVTRWQGALAHRPSLLSRLAVKRGWRYGVMCELEVGIDPGGRLTIPIRDAAENLQGVLRYQPWHTHPPKMLAVRGTRLGLIPHPARESSHQLLLVEGPADMIAARSHGMTAIAVPGTHAWRSEWATLLAGRRLTVLMDCDRPGREAAQRIQRDLAGMADVSLVDLDPGRDDGYDLTDALLERSHTSIGPPALAWLQRDAARVPDRYERGIER